MWNQELSGAAVKAQPGRSAAKPRAPVETLDQPVQVVFACSCDNGEADVVPSSAGGRGLGGRLTRDALVWRFHRMPNHAEEC